jgi:hypothetical protein
LMPGFFLGNDNCIEILGRIEPGQGVIHDPDTIIAFFLIPFNLDLQATGIRKRCVRNFPGITKSAFISIPLPPPE